MAGKYNGVQENILQENKFVRFVPCAAHSLNLAGVMQLLQVQDISHLFKFQKLLLNVNEHTIDLQIT
jgi:hypothetical protein